MRKGKAKVKSQKAKVKSSVGYERCAQTGTEHSVRAETLLTFALLLTLP
jgi:ribosomal protein S14